MLEPIFFAVPPDFELGPNVTYIVMGYSRVGEFTIVNWRIGNKEFFEGESLWRGTTLLVSDGGQLPIWQPETSAPTVTPERPVSTFDRVNRSLGQFGIPPAIAKALRDPKNRVVFQR